MASSPPPPTYRSQASVSKSGRSSASIQSLADSMLQASIERDRSASSPAVLSASARSNSSSASSSTLRPSVRSVSSSNTSSSITRGMFSQSQSSSSTAVAGLRSSTNLPGTPLSRPPSYVSINERKAKMAELSNDTKAMQKVAKVSQSSKFTFRQACSTDLLFLIDCTNSMTRYIEDVKKNVKKIVDDITTAFFNDAEILVAIVAYRDHGLAVNIEALDFTSNLHQVVSFLDGLKTGYGHDIPEDVLGGINRALNMTWSQATRCIIHIGDAPPHGRELQDPIATDDRFPTPGSEPHKLTYTSLIEMMIKMGINYVLLPINDSMDKMAFRFAAIYLEKAAGAKFHHTHRYYQTLQNLKRIKSTGSLTAAGQIMCMVAEMGTVYGHLEKLVVKNVLDSASRTAIRTSAKHFAKASSGCSALGTISEESFNTTIPNWDQTTSFPILTDMEGFAPDIITQDNKTLYKMMHSDDNIRIGLVNLSIYRQPKPFSKGAFRLAYYARTLYSNTPYVVKSFETGGRELPHLVEDMKIQSLCKAFALEFNAATGHPESGLDFLLTTSLSPLDGALTKYSIERYIAGSYTKYNNNAGFVLDSSDPSISKINDLAQAFSHFTFEISRGEFLVCDLQGVGNTLTDPTIHTRDPNRFLLTETNLSVEGFKFFFATHECNHICKALQLQSNKNMFLKRAFTFRDRWPPVSQTVCCSNKLCGRIVRAESVRKSAIHPGFFWCEGCWPQIGNSMVALACDSGSGYGAGASTTAGSAGGVVVVGHSFEESAFFWESQGRGLPARCAQHRAAEEQVTPGLSREGAKQGFMKRFSFGSLRAKS